ncbi:YiiD C-terminal domain-containing protein [Litorivivens sp.]|uniref:YiiD C-terminal domain-containing protein n=1 Tax=Litorivivens sp. TaxID=2020868 RepID=UPI00356B356F
MKDVAHKLTEFVQAHLPTARALEIEVADYDSESLTLRAPLGPSINDKHTAFGGSLYVVAVMAGWGMVYLRCREAGIDPNIVVAKGEIEYQAPVPTDIVASSIALEESEWDAFFQHFDERGKSKIELRTQVLQDGKPAVSFKGLYAIIGLAPNL